MADHSAQPRSKEDIRITVKVVPGSSRTEFAGFQGDVMRIKIAAVPEKGKANKELITFLAKKFNIRKNDVQIQSGQTGRIKQIAIRGVSIRDVHSHFTTS